MTTGTLIAIMGAGLATIVCGLGSAIAVQMSGKAASGVVSENPDLFTKVLILQVLPGSQGIYGFLTAFILMINIGAIGGNIAELSTDIGWAYFGACMPVTIVGFVSAIYQAKLAVSAIHMTAKQPESSTKGMIMTAIVETYAILSLLISILLIIGI